MDKAEISAHRTVTIVYRDEEIVGYELCPDCYRSFEGMVNTFLSDGQDWTAAWGRTVVDITENGFQTRIDDDRQPWNEVVHDEVRK